MIKQKNIATAIILSIITCGIYFYVWMYDITESANVVSNSSEITPGMAILLSIITCGIFSIYWNYKMGKQIYEARLNRGMNASDNSILYLILSLLGWSIINVALMQSDLNEMAK